MGFASSASPQEVIMALNGEIMAAVAITNLKLDIVFLHFQRYREVIITPNNAISTRDADRLFHPPNPMDLLAVGPHETLCNSCRRGSLPFRPWDRFLPFETNPRHDSGVYVSCTIPSSPVPWVSIATQGATSADTTSFLQIVSNLECSPIFNYVKVMRGRFPPGSNVLVPYPSLSPCIGVGLCQLIPHVAEPKY
ncbi:hypothetical protein BD779DRAFT_300650 [Infundibulicybe gibba]|nr:hypothetical protein BD779DRAFT_300650 [Infundibulicybe gibba]